MTNTSTVAVGVDRAWQEHGALAWAYDEARRARSALRVVHVVDDRFGEAPELGSAAREQAADLIADVRTHLEGDDSATPLTSDAVSGRPGPALVRAAAADRMLVVGRRGSGSFGRLLLGSTAESAVNHADIPVVVVPEVWDTAAHRTAPVVAGVDPAAAGEAAIEFACTVATERSVPVVLVHVWDVPSLYSWDNAMLSDVEQTWERRAREELDRTVQQWQEKYPDADVRGELRQGHPAEGLLDASIGREAQLVVVGGRRHNRLTGLVLGSVARAVLHHADCPVAVVHDVARGNGTAG
ncbi:MAG TPA: universal stress protein [Kribbellaceae bacterium]|jgi:nucleotide-binding universal stress UspA family protein